MTKAWLHIRATLPMVDRFTLISLSLTTRLCWISCHNHLPPPSSFEAIDLLAAIIYRFLTILGSEHQSGSTCSPSFYDVTTEVKSSSRVIYG
jgi:hypothetical protein